MATRKTAAKKTSGKRSTVKKGAPAKSTKKAPAKAVVKKASKKASAKKAPDKRAPAKSSSRRASAKKTAVKNAAKQTPPKSMPGSGKDPKGGLTAAGRAYFKKKEGSNLRPGVQGAADTPEKMKRKGSFLRRHFTHPRGPMKDEKGEPTRLALSAHAWGEPVPETTGDAKKLAAKGKELLEEFHKAKGDA